MTTPPFTPADAQAIIQIAEEAPIPGGARMAAARSQLYQRFANWFEEATKALAERDAKQAAEEAAGSQ